MRFSRPAVFAFAALVATATSSWSCADFLAGLSRDGSPGASEPPPDLAARRFGRWTCAAELPYGRPTSVFELLRRLGPGKAWNLVVDADGLAELQVVGHRGRSRQGCWAELSAEELQILEKDVRGAELCVPSTEPKPSDTQNAFDFEIHFRDFACTRRVTASALQRSPSGRRFADELRGWLDWVSNGSFDKVEAFALAGEPRRPRNAVARPLPSNTRLACGSERETIFEPGDPWLLDYTFQRGLLWRRDIQVSASGVIALDLASLQSRARTSCTGRLAPEEIATLRATLEQSHPCNLPTGEPRLREDRGYLSVNGPGALCRFRALRGSDLAWSWDGRRFEKAVGDLVGLAGPGAVDPFDAHVGLLFDGRSPPPGPRDKPSSGRRRAREESAASPL